MGVIVGLFTGGVGLALAALALTARLSADRSGGVGRDLLARFLIYLCAGWFVWGILAVIVAPLAAKSIPEAIGIVSAIAGGGTLVLIVVKPSLILEIMTRNNQ